VAQEFKVEFTKYQSEMSHLLSGLDEQPSGAEGSQEVDEAAAAVESLSVAAAAPEEKTGDTATNEDNIS